MRAAALLLALAACGAPRPAQRSSPAEVVDVELTDADLIDALRTVAGGARVSLFADPDLAGLASVSLHVHAAPWSELLAQLARDHALRIERLDVPGSPRPALWVTRQASPPAPRTTFTGASIEARFDDTPVRDAAATLAAAGQVAITIDDGVDVAVTLHLRGIPWDLALYHLAQKYGLRIVEDGGAYRIARKE